MPTKTRIRLFGASVLAALTAITAWGLSVDAGRHAPQRAQPAVATAQVAPASPAAVILDDDGESE